MLQLQRVGTALAIESTTVTIPAGHQNGDIIVIFAFRDGSTTNPTIPAGWTTLTNTLDGTLCSASVAWKIAGSASETSGTWTNATGLICHVFRNVATNKTPIGVGVGTAGTATSATYGALTLKCPYTSRLLAFAAHRSTDTNLQNAPTNLTNVSTLAGASSEFAGHDSNGAYNSASWPSTDVALGGTASGWITFIIEIFAEGSNFENYKYISVGDGASTNERIK